MPDMPPQQWPLPAPLPAMPVPVPPYLPLAPPPPPPTGNPGGGSPPVDVTAAALAALPPHLHEAVLPPPAPPGVDPVCGPFYAKPTPPNVLALTVHKADEFRRAAVWLGDLHRRTLHVNLRSLQRCPAHGVPRAWCAHAGRT